MFVGKKILKMRGVWKRIDNNYFPNKFYVLRKGEINYEKKKKSRRPKH